jgi:dTMP kinase
LAELFLYEADRAQHVDQTLKPAFRHGQIVLCDRYTDSTLAYQGHGRGLDLDTIKTLNAVASDHLQPQLTILLDVPVARGLQQAHRKKHRHDRLERAGLAFHKRVRAGFLHLARQESRRICVIPQQATVESTQAAIRRTVDTFLDA